MLVVRIRLLNQYYTTTTTKKTTTIKQVIISTLEDIEGIEEVKVGVLENNYIEINDDDGSDSELPSLDF